MAQYIDGERIVDAVGNPQYVCLEIGCGFIGDLVGIRSHAEAKLIEWQIDIGADIAYEEVPDYCNPQSYAEVVITQPQTE
jgi:hypothetical protein